MRLLFQVMKCIRKNAHSNKKALKKKKTHASYINTPFFFPHKKTSITYLTSLKHPHSFSYCCPCTIL